jgi:luciferase-like monooxygenase
MEGYTLAIERELLNWPGVSSEPGRFGATSFRYGKREIGHVHRDRIADLPVTREMREEILARGRARPHRAGVKGYISYPIENPEDVSEVLEILGRNYDRAKTAAQRRGSQASEE